MNNAATVCSNLSELTTDEKREIWMKRNRCTVSRLAEVAGVTVSSLSRALRNSTMPVAQHQALVDFGVPAELLPRPFNRKPGPRPTYQPSISA
ncbi:helix-turn-helix domain-containing protein [Bilophila wadsworthia]